MIDIFYSKSNNPIAKKKNHSHSFNEINQSSDKVLSKSVDKKSKKQLKTFLTKLFSYFCNGKLLFFKKKCKV